VSCYKGGAGQSGEPAMQWVFSDGLASVSVFVESFDRARHLQEGGARIGATQTWMERLDSHWLTLVGEVPIATLKAFAGSLERKKPN
jgi:sigma-E factor negative regulatory protein RseB